MIFIFKNKNSNLLIFVKNVKMTFFFENISNLYTLTTEASIKNIIMSQLFDSKPVVDFYGSISSYDDDEFYTPSSDVVFGIEFYYGDDMVPDTNQPIKEFEKQFGMKIKKDVFYF